MSLICNKLLGLGQAALRTKKQLAHNAGVELLGAISDVFRALELRNHGADANSAGVYIASADARLRNAAEQLAEVETVLRSVSLTEETVAWYQSVEYSRLYEVGVAAGQIPANSEVWAELLEPLPTGGPAAVCDAYRRRVLRLADLLADWRRSAAHDGDPSTDEILVAIQSATVSLTIYAQFVAYVNKVEPLDERWLPMVSAVAVAQG